jgi:hypothetical protein
LSRWLPTLLLLAPSLAALAGCQHELGRSTEEHPCRLDNHCVRMAGEVYCEEGFTWEDPNDATNYVCVPSTQGDTTGIEGGAPAPGGTETTEAQPAPTTPGAGDEQPEGEPPAADTEAREEGGTPESSAGCGDVTWVGHCEGNTAVYCIDNIVYRDDCGELGDECLLLEETTGTACYPPVEEYRVQGRALYEKRDATVDGLGPVYERGIPHALVWVLSAVDDWTYGLGATNADGSFDIVFEAIPDEPVYLMVAAASDELRVSVGDCPDGGCEGGSYLNAMYSGDLTTSAVMDAGDLVAPATGIGRAFNVLDVLGEGLAHAESTFGHVLPTLRAEWREGADTICEAPSSCYAGGTIYVRDALDDSDGYDDSVLLHELAHFVTDEVGRSDSPGGPHDGSKTDPRLAWDEGFSTFFGGSVREDPVFVDTVSGGVISWSTDDTGETGSRFGDLDQDVSEDLVSAALWGLKDGRGGLAGAGVSPIFDVVQSYLPSATMADRGVAGVDLVDFLDGWLCLGHSDEALVDEVVKDDLRFPYDFDGPTGCQ